MGEGVRNCPEWRDVIYETPHNIKFVVASLKTNLQTSVTSTDLKHLQPCGNQFVNRVQKLLPVDIYFGYLMVFFILKAIRT